MRRETRTALYAAHEDGLSLADRIADARTRARPAPIAGGEVTLPSGPEVPLVTLTTDQLHDLVYAAASQYLRELSGMAGDRARTHASRIAARADLIAHTEHDVTMGRPR